MSNDTQQLVTEDDSTEAILEMFIDNQNIRRAVKIGLQHPQVAQTIEAATTQPQIAKALQIVNFGKVNDLLAEHEVKKTDMIGLLKLIFDLVRTKDNMERFSIVSQYAMKNQNNSLVTKAGQLLQGGLLKEKSDDPNVQMLLKIGGFLSKGALGSVVQNPAMITTFMSMIA